jgi:hypothetical protein
MELSKGDVLVLLLSVLVLTGAVVLGVSECQRPLTPEEIAQRREWARESWSENDLRRIVREECAHRGGGDRE